MEPTRSAAPAIAILGSMALCALYVGSYFAARASHTLVHREDYPPYSIATVHTVGPGDDKPLGPTAAVIFAPLCLVEGAYWSAARR